MNQRVSGTRILRVIQGRDARAVYPVPSTRIIAL